MLAKAIGRTRLRGIVRLLTVVGNVMAKGILRGTPCGRRRQPRLPGC
jgi:hypothetical protein